MLTSGSPNPPPEVLCHFVGVYENKLHLQPLPLFDIDNLPGEVAYFPEFLLHAFMAITLPFLEHSFYGDRKPTVIDFYVRSARKTTIGLASQGILSLNILQSICLLTLVDIAGECSFFGMHKCIR